MGLRGVPGRSSRKGKCPCWEGDTGDGYAGGDTSGVECGSGAVTSPLCFSEPPSGKDLTLAPSTTSHEIVGDDIASARIVLGDVWRRCRYHASNRKAGIAYALQRGVDLTSVLVQGVDLPTSSCIIAIYGACHFLRFFFRRSCGFVRMKKRF